MDGVKHLRLTGMNTNIFKHKHIPDMKEDPIIFLQVMVDPTGVEGVNFFYAVYQITLKLCFIP